MEKGYPLLIIFYLDRSVFGVDEGKIVGEFAASVNDALAQRKANAMAFFIPTDGEERVECINPVQVAEAEMDKINQMVEDIKKNFDVGQGADEGKNDPENEVEIDGED